MRETIFIRPLRLFNQIGRVKSPEEGVPLEWIRLSTTFPDLAKTGAKAWAPAGLCGCITS